MTTKILCAIALIFALVFALASCDVYDILKHTHSYGDWETTKTATCTQEGSKERYCQCGEKQTATIPTANHNMVDGICTSCGYENAENSGNGNSSGNTTAQKLTKDEWVSILDSNQYQSYIMTIKEEKNLEFGYDYTANTSIQYKHPYFQISANGTDKYDGIVDEVYNETIYMDGGVEDLRKNAGIPTVIGTFFESITELEGSGYSKFIFDAESNTYSSGLFDEFDSVIITLENNKIKNIKLSREYTDSDYGTVLESYEIELSNINNTPKPSAPDKKDITQQIKALAPSINSATEARKGYQSSYKYDIEEAKQTFTNLISTFSTDYLTIYKYEEYEYTETDFETNETETGAYTEMVFKLAEKNSVTLMGSEFSYDTIKISIWDGKLETFYCTNDSQMAFSIYFFY